MRRPFVLAALVLLAGFVVVVLTVDLSTPYVDDHGHCGSTDHLTVHRFDTAPPEHTLDWTEVPPDDRSPLVEELLAAASQDGGFVDRPADTAEAEIDRLRASLAAQGRSPQPDRPHAYVLYEGASYRFLVTTVTC